MYLHTVRTPTNDNVEQQQKQQKRRSSGLKCLLKNLQEVYCDGKLADLLKDYNVMVIEVDLID